MSIKGKKLGIIGAGNMSTAIINGVILSDILKPSDIFVSDIDTKKLSELKKFKINIENSNIELAKNCDVIILAVKPTIYETVLNEIKEFNNKIFVSIAPGISISFIKEILGENAKVVRTMPNTPSMVQMGMTVLCYKKPVTKDEFDSVLEIFNAIGLTQELDEKLLNSVVAVNGSSPAYVYMMIEAMADAACKNGIPRDIAYKLSAQSVMGSAKMVLETKEHPARLKDNVCSPGGTTIEAVNCLEEKGFRASIIEAMDKCTKKANMLSK